MVPETHRSVAGAVFHHMETETGIILDKKRLLRGSIAPDLYPKYKFIPHYFSESIDYIVDQIITLVPFMSKIVYDSAWNGLLSGPISYKLGVICHYLSDYMTHPHARRIRFTSAKDIREHVRYENALNQYAKSHPLDPDMASNMAMGSFQGGLQDLKVYVKTQILRFIDQYLQKEISFENDYSDAFILNVFVFQTVCEAAFAYGRQTQLQTV